MANFRAKNAVKRNSFASQLKIIFILFVFAAAIYSCKKDLNTKTTVANRAVAKAQDWYLHQYPVSAGSVSNSQLKLQSTGQSADYSQLTNPDWDHASQYRRFDKDVLEIPVDPDSKIGSVLKNAVTNQTYGNTKYSKSSFLIFKDSSGYNAYVMTIIADSAYLKGDTSKLKNNTFLKHDQDFSGLVLYFTPNGEYLNGYKYVDGQLLTSPAPVTASGTMRVQTLQVSCTDYFLDTYVNDVRTSSGYAYTECSASGSTGSTGGGSGSGGAGGGSGGGSGPGTPPAVSNPCLPSKGGTVEASVNNVQRTQQYQPNPNDPTDNGFPPPASPTPCQVVRPTPPAIITNNLQNACLKDVLNKLTQTTNLNGKIADIIHNTFATNDKVNLTFEEYTSTNDGPAQTLPATIDNNGVYNETIKLNLSKLNNSSQEFSATTMIHETLHAYMNYNSNLKTQLSQHQEMASKYLSDIRTFLQQVFPTLSTDNANSLILRGLGDVFDQKPAYWNTLLTELNTSNVTIEITSDGYKNGQMGYGTKCQTN